MDKKISVIYTERVSVALIFRMQRTYPILNSYLWPVWPCHFLPHYFINGTILGNEVIEGKIFVLIFSTTFSETFFVPRRVKRDVVFIQSARYYCQISVSSDFSSQIFEIYRNIKFHKNPPSEGRVAPFGRTHRRTDGETDRGTDKTNLIVVFLSYAKASKTT